MRSRRGKPTTSRRHVLCAVLALASAKAALALPGEGVELPAPVLEDKIRGGLVGQLLGNLNGMRHEARYIDEPGEVESYVPSLPEGARTDDDTDIEWLYVLAMEDASDLELPGHEIHRLWAEHVNRRIWSANQYSRQLMDLGLEPPLTGHGALNPWADFNIAGQFLSETFALISPALPRSASELALHYVHVAVDGEPAQATQLFATMISTAFVESDREALLDAGVAATDPRSQVRAIVAQVRDWHQRHPDDWRTTRRRVRDAWTRHGGSRRDENGYELNTAATVAAFLYGDGDFVETLRLAFAFGWDADNNAAIVGTVLGVIRGHRWMQEQGWQIGDRYRNTTRDGLPTDETLTRFGDRLLRLARRQVTASGGQIVTEGTEEIVRIPLQRPTNVEPLVGNEVRLDRLRLKLGGEVEATVAGETTGRELARAAYLAICLDLATELRRQHPRRWQEALAALGEFPQVAQVLYHRSPVPEAARLRAKATAAGLDEPATVEPLWQQRLDLYDASEDPAQASRPLVARLLHYRDGVQQAFAVADIDQVIVETLRLHRVAVESSELTRDLASELRTLSRTPPADPVAVAARGKANDALTKLLGSGTDRTPAPTTPLAGSLLALRESASPLSPPEDLADLVDEAGSRILESATLIRRGVELGEREPIATGLERLAPLLDELLPLITNPEQ